MASSTVDTASATVSVEETMQPAKKKVHLEASASHPVVTGKTRRGLSLARQIDAAGGIAAWNDRTPAAAKQWRDLEAKVKATTVTKATAEVNKLIESGDSMAVYQYFRVLHNRDIDLFYGMLLEQPEKLMPYAYTPTVGKACQNFGNIPQFSRGCYVCIEHRGKIKSVLEDYACAHMDPNPDVPGQYLCDCIVFSDGGRILGLGDLAAWGMGIPIGKLDLYTVCGGVDPRRTIPVILDVGCLNPEGNTAKLNIRESVNYTGMKKDRVRSKNADGNLINSAYYGKDNIIEEFMNACKAVFGPYVLMQFEDFNSNDAFPLLSRTREKYLTYNDDIQVGRMDKRQPNQIYLILAITCDQGTAAVTLAGMFGALKLKYPSETNLLPLLIKEKVLFFGAGSANIGAADLLVSAGGMPKENITMTGSRGLLWISADGSKGCFRNDKQKFYAVSPEPSWPHKNILDVVANTKPTVLVGAAGLAPGAFTKDVIETMCEINSRGDASDPSQRPVIFALSNPDSQAECTAAECYTHSKGAAIYGSGTQFPRFTVNGQERQPGMVNNVYVFPAMSFAAVHCRATKITDRLFLVAAEAVANSLNEADLKADRVIPSRSRIREVEHRVATAVILACQKDGLARRHVGDDWDSVFANVGKAMWSPSKN